MSKKFLVYFVVWSLILSGLIISSKLINSYNNQNIDDLDNNQLFKNEMLFLEPNHNLKVIETTQNEYLIVNQTTEETLQIVKYDHTFNQIFQKTLSGNFSIRENAIVFLQELSHN